MLLVLLEAIRLLNLEEKNQLSPKILYTSLYNFSERLLA